MSQESFPPQNPLGGSPQNLESGAYAPDASQFSNINKKRREFPTMEENLNSTMTGSRRTRSIMTPKLAILLIFVGTFILSVLFTSAILSGMIEIQPSAIKAFFRSIFK